MSDLREMSTTRHRLDTSSQSSDEFLQQFPAPPVPQHFSDTNAFDNNGSHRLNEMAFSGSNAPTLNSYPMATNASAQKPNENSNHTTDHQSSAASAPAAQSEASIPNAYALNTGFTFVDKPEKKVHWTKRNCFLRWICCSMCFPPWVAYIVWFIVTAVIICIIVIGAILGSFKTPTIDLAGLNSTLPNGTQQIEFSSTGVVIHAGLILNVINSNILSMKLSNLTAKAYYPINGTMVQIGKGYLDYQFIPKKSNINFTYPFQIDYNPSDSNSRYLMSSISDKCGFTGNPPSDIDIRYDVSLNAQVLFVHVSPTISSSASFACPFQSGQIPGLSSTGSSGEGGLDGILGGLGAQVNETSSTITHVTARATALPSSLSITAHSSIVRSTSLSITPTLLPTTTSQSTRISASSVVPTATFSASPAVLLSSASPSTIVASRTTTATTISSVPLLTSTFVAHISVSALSTASSAVVPTPFTSARPRVMLSSTNIQPTSRTALATHASSIPATSARPTTTFRTSATRPMPTPEGNEDDDDGDDGDDSDDGDDEDDSDDDDNTDQ